ncbi:MAG TPA: glycoside hydrolase family 13 protein [Prolixibacteraceae bacterium]|nr:glycoside hydrolase family 13 protein [Prolixibacteraceae bacterium]
MRKLFLFITCIVFSISVFALNVDRVEPTFWWVGMKNPTVQLMVHGQEIATSEVSLNYPGVRINSVSRQENPNYLFVDISISPEAKAGTFPIQFRKNKKEIISYSYELKNREPNSAKRKGFDASDVIYLITPDRYANGNPANDAVVGLKELPNRADKNGRHGGDIQGIENSLDYISEMGFTSIWLNPVLENNMTQVSYHGYSTTDFYKLDARYGSNEEYRELAQSIHKKGMKLMMDMIFNHIGSEHWWMNDMPSSDWLNLYPDYKITNHRHTVIEDPYASEADKKMLSDGWFVPSMPDLNQNNPFLATYLIQNSIWWTEYVGLDGIRMDTYAYPDKYMMAEWTRRMLEEYPDFYIVGEEWSMNPAIVAYWQKGNVNSDGYVSYLPGLMDFPLNNAVIKGLKEPESWDAGFETMYVALSNDFIYANPSKLVVFPDNHDMSRFYTQLDENFDWWKMGIVYYATTRGIPQIFYGTEILMTNPGPKDDGIIRSDFPGGWDGDPMNAFTGEGLSDKQKEAQDFIRNVLNWRKTSEAVHSGELKHFIPEDGIYVYFRYNQDEKVMVVLNKNAQEKTIDTSRFGEIMGNCTSGKDVISGMNITDLKNLKSPAMSAMIIELK